MKLEQMFPHFNQLQEIEREECVRTYRERRLRELSSATEESTKQCQKMTLTPEEEVAMKLLGMTKKAIFALRSISEPEESEDAAVLLSEDDIIEGEE